MTEAALGVRAPEPAAAEALFNRVLPADHLSVRGALTDLHARLSPHVSADVMGRLELVLAEVMNNIVRHGADAARRARDKRDADHHSCPLAWSPAGTASSCTVATVSVMVAMTSSRCSGSGTMVATTTTDKSGSSYQSVKIAPRPGATSV